MGLSLDEKQLLKSLADVIISDPNFAQRLLSVLSDAGQQPNLLNKINSINEMINNYSAYDSDKVKYISELKKAISKIKDSDASAILLESIKNSSYDSII
ncbi:hypothetical protein [Aeromonas veronii]|uniref:hypothetical protein n=1 Tax=Aeromonas TaxID=642 RepID=UPI001F246F8A|nr:hypothetical protein [Aeromonas veronii]MCF5896359.1 hypothetical protein [Aeromonas veronii]